MPRKMRALKRPGLKKAMQNGVSSKKNTMQGVANNNLDSPADLLNDDFRSSVFRSTQMHEANNDINRG